MAKRNQEPPAGCEAIAIGRRDWLRGDAAGTFGHSEPRGCHRKTAEESNTQNGGVDQCPRSRHSSISV